MRAWIATLILAGIPGCSQVSAEPAPKAEPPKAEPTDKKPDAAGQKKTKAKKKRKPRPKDDESARSARPQP